MGIINDYRKNNKRFTYQEPTKEADTKMSKILDLTYMKKLISDVMGYHKTKESKTKVKDYRKWTYVQTWQLQNLLGYVDTPTFVFMLESCIAWCVDVRSSIDANGGVQTEKIVEAVQYLVIGLQFVDINGNQDLQYDMGRPKANSDQAITPKMLRDILSSQGSKVVDTPVMQDDKYKDVIEQQQTRIAEQDASMIEMKEQMTQMQEMVAGLITELQTARNSDIVDSSPKPVKKTPEKKRSK